VLRQVEDTESIRQDLGRGDELLRDDRAEMKGQVNERSYRYAPK
jgi:hypothetical protein